MKSIMRHAILERRLRVILYLAAALASLAAILGLMSLVLPIPEDAMTIAATMAMVCGFYALGLRDADLAIYRSQHPIVQEISATKV